MSSFNRFHATHKFKYGRSQKNKRRYSLRTRGQMSPVCSHTLCRSDGIAKYRHGRGVYDCGHSIIGRDRGLFAVGRVYGLDNVRIHVNYSGFPWSNWDWTSHFDGFQYPFYCDLYACLRKRRTGLTGDFDRCLDARSVGAHDVPSAVAPDIYANRQWHNCDVGRSYGSSLPV